MTQYSKTPLRALATSQIFTNPNGQITGNILGTLLSNIADSAVNEVDFRQESGMIADDSVWAFSFGVPILGSIVLMLTNIINNGAGVFYIRSFTTPGITSLASANINILSPAGTVPSGTTGTNGFTSISCNTSGTIYLENRRGFPISASAWVFR